MKENDEKSSCMPFLILIGIIIYFAVILFGFLSGNISLQTPPGYDPSEHSIMRGKD